MMTDLISRAAAIAEIDEYLHGLDSCISEPDLKLDGYKNGLQVAIHELNALPAVDAVPVEWLKAQIAPHRGDISDLGKSAHNATIKNLIYKWQKEQEAQDDEN